MSTWARVVALVCLQKRRKKEERRGGGEGREREETL
jgi:hypothetical protein